MYNIIVKVTWFTMELQDIYQSFQTDHADVDLLGIDFTSDVDLFLNEVQAYEYRTSFGPTFQDLPISLTSSLTPAHATQQPCQHIYMPSEPFNFVPDPPVKSKNTDVKQLMEQDALLLEAIEARNDVSIARHDYVYFGEQLDGPVGVTNRDIDRNKDIALTLKMVCAMYRIPLHEVYGQLAKMASFDCVLCEVKRPQRGSLTCYHCGVRSKASFADLVKLYMCKMKM